MVTDILRFALLLFIILLFARVVVNLLFLFSRDWKPKGAALLVVEGVLSATDPPVRFVRSLLPNLSLGGVRFDLSVLVLMILATLAINILSVV